MGERKEGREVVRHAGILNPPMPSHYFTYSFNKRILVANCMHLDARGVTVNNTDHASALGKLTFSLGEEQVKISRPRELVTGTKMTHGVGVPAGYMGGRWCPGMLH